MNSETRSLTGGSKGVHRKLGLVSVLVMACWLLLSGTAFANFSTIPGWYWVNPLPAGIHTWISASMYEDEAWISSADSLLLHSTDSGRTWRTLNSNGPTGLDDLSFTSPTAGWALKYGQGVQRTTDAGQTWTSSLNPGGWFTDLYCLDATHVWAGWTDSSSYVSTTHTYYYTTDGGASWQTETLPVPFEDVVFTSATDGWGVGNSYTFTVGGAINDVTSTIYHTTDAGVTWSVARNAPHEELNSITAVDASHLVVGGATVTYRGVNTLASFSPLAARSSDGGVSWSSATLPDVWNYEGRVRSLAFSDDTRGWARTEYSHDDNYGNVTITEAVYATTDGGATWSTLGTQGATAIACNSAGDLVACDSNHVMAAPWGSPFAVVDPSSIGSTGAPTSLCFSSAQRGWGVSGTTVYSTTDGGARWDQSLITSLTAADQLNRICCQTVTGGPLGQLVLLWAVGDKGTMVESADDGATWSAVDSTTSQDLTDITFSDDSNGWAVGGASLLHTVDGGQSWNPLYLNGTHTWAGVDCPSATTICVAGTDSIAGRGCVVRSTDGGATWQQVLTSSGSHLLGTRFLDSSQGWAWGDKANLYATTNGGTSWAAQNISSLFTSADLPCVRIYDVAFTDTSTGFAVCSVVPTSGSHAVSGSYILSTTDCGATWTKTNTGLPSYRDAVTHLVQQGFLGTIATSGEQVWLAGGNGVILANFDPDPTPPVTTDAYDGRWSNQAVTLDFSATDSGVGVAYTHFIGDLAPWTYGNSLTVPALADHSTDGAHKVLYQSVDKLGNAETPQTQLVNIDTVPPTAPGVVADPDPATTGGYVGPNPTFRFRGLDSALAASLHAGSSMTRVAVSGSDAYIADGTTLRVVDVSDPWAPQQVGSLVFEMVGVSDVAASGSLACLALGNNGLDTVDTSDPTHPTVEGSCAIAGGANHVALYRGYAYVATGSSTVVTVDLSNPAAPAVVASIAVASPADLAVGKARLCAASSVGLTVLNTANPAEPTLLGTCHLAAAGKGVGVRSELACVADGTSGVYLVNVGGTRPTVVSHTSYSGNLGTAALSGSLAMIGKAAAVAGGNGSVLVLDVTSTSRPVVLGTITTTATPLALAADGQYLYAAEGSSGPRATGFGIWKVMPTESASYLIDTTAGTVPDTVPESGVSSATFSGLAGGAAYFHVRTCDQAGNWGPSSNLAFTVDAAPPVTTDNAGSAWHAAPFTLTLTPSDSASGTSGGLAKTEYSIDGGTTWLSGTSLAFAAWKRGGGSGSYPVLVRSTDAVGNLETPHTVTVKVDGSHPTSADDAPGTVQSGPVTVHLKGSDAYSGVAFIWYSLDGGTWTQVAYPGGLGVAVSVSGAGSHTLCYYAVDGVGNVQVGYRVCMVTINSGGVAASRALHQGRTRTIGRHLLRPYR